MKNNSESKKLDRTSGEETKYKSRVKQSVKKITLQKRRKIKK